MTSAPLGRMTFRIQGTFMKFLMCVFLCLLAAGCATTAPQRDATEAFGLATDRFGRMGEEEFTAVRNGIIRLRKFQAILDSAAAADDLQFDAPATSETTAERLSACKSLRMYGDLLMRLASDDRTQFVRRSAIVFADSVEETLGASLDAEQQAAIDNVIAGLSGFWTQKRKTESIRNVLLAYEDVVNAMADRIQADFVLGGAPGTFLAAYDDAARRLQDTAAPIVDAGPSVDPNLRRQAVNAYYMAQAAQVRARDIGVRMENAVGTLKKANAEIVSGTRGKACDTELIKEYGRLIQKIANLRQVMPR